MANFLIVDDSAIVRKTIKKQLQTLGQNVPFEADNGKEAFEYYQSNMEMIDVITLDISMPVVNGLDALKDIMKIDKNAVVFMITSHGEESMVLDAIELGATGYILKPVTEKKLQKIIEEVQKDEL